MPDVMLGGAWLQTLGHVESVAYVSRWGASGCGPYEATVTLAMPTENETSAVRLNLPLEVYADNGVRQFGGYVFETDRAYPRTIKARGYVRLAEDFDTDSLTVNTAVTNAQGRGLRWTGTPFPATVLGTGINERPPRLSALLSQFTEVTGNKYGVNALGAAFVATDPVTPSWYLDARDLNIAVADDGLFTSVRARYVSAQSGTPPVATAWLVSTALAAQAVRDMFGVIEYPLDLTPLGQITGPVAADYAVKQLALLSKPQWLNRIAVTGKELRTEGGLSVDVQTVRAGQMVRLMNVPSRLGGLITELDLNIILGEVAYDTANPSEVSLAPTNLAVANISDAFERTTDSAA